MMTTGSAIREAYIKNILIPARLGQILDAGVCQHEHIPTAAHRPHYCDGPALSTEARRSFVRNETSVDR